MEENTLESTVEITIRSGTPEDVPRLVALHHVVSEYHGALIREKEEITNAYMEEEVQKCRSKGLLLIAEIGEELVGEIHAHTPVLFAFSHLLSDLTIVVHPKHQGKGVGRKLFESFLWRVQEDFPHILRVELFTREHKEKNVAFYTSLGFQNEGRQANKIRLQGNRFHTPIHMVWINPKYQSK